MQAHKLCELHGCSFMMLSVTCHLCSFLWLDHIVLNSIIFSDTLNLFSYKSSKVFS